MTIRKTYRPSLASWPVAWLMRPRAVHRRFLPRRLQGENRSYARFMVMAHQRSGSSTLTSTLRRHSQIVAFGELYKPRHLSFKVEGYPDSSGPLRRLRDFYPVEFLERVVYGSYHDDIQAVGFKVFPDQLQPACFEPVWRWLDETPDVKVVLLQRRNLLAAFTSLKVAQATSVWGVSDPSQRPRVQVTLDYQQMVQAFQRRRRLHRQAEQRLAGHPMHQLQYEDMVADLDGHLGRVQDFLGVPREVLKTNSIKGEVRPLSEVITNYGELKERCAESEWSEFFE